MAVWLIEAVAQVSYLMNNPDLRSAAAGVQEGKRWANLSPKYDGLNQVPQRFLRLKSKEQA